MENNNKKVINQDTTNEKKTWMNPEVIDLDINKETLNATKGPSGGDGGGFFNDYNS